MSRHLAPGRRTFFKGLGAAAILAPLQVSAQNMTALLRTEARFFPVYVAAQNNPPTPLNQQLLAFWQSLVGDETGAFKTWAQFNDPATIDAATLAGFHNRAALADIVARAKDRRIIILNEAHHISCCRVFAEQVAIALAPLGFNLLAAEAFSNGRDSHWVADINAGGAPTTAEGVYTPDPCFGELLRGARKAGYRLAAYEAHDDQKAPAGASRIVQINTRDAAQAENLAALFNSQPDAKILVYCGFEHVSKSGRDGEIWLAQRLKEMTGHDPLCITQAYGVGAPDPTDDDGNLRVILKTLAPNGSVSIADASGTPLDLTLAPGAVDLAVYHPAVPAINGRSGWLATAPGRKRVDLTFPAGTLDDGLLQAFHADEPINAIPADQCLVSQGTTTATVFLRPGKYRILLDQFDTRKDVSTVTV